MTSDLTNRIAMALAALLAMACPVQRAIADPRLEQVIASYRNSLENLPRGEFTARRESKIYESQSLQGTNILVHEINEDVKCRRDADRWYICTLLQSQRLLNGKPRDGTTRSEFVVNDKFVTVDFTRSNGFTVDADMDGAEEDLEPKARTWIVGVMGVQLGYLDGHTELWFPDILERQSDVRISDAVLEEMPVYIIEARGEWGNYKCWVDPAAGYSLKRAVIEKDAHHRTSADKSVSD